MSAADDPNPPAMSTGMGERGAALWRHVTTSYVLSRVEVELLTEACRTLDTVEALSAIAADAATVDDRLRAERELRQQRTTAARLLAQLELPDDDGDRLATPTQARARRAANARWSRRQAG